MEKLSIYINDELAFDFDKDYPVEDEQLTFLDNMDVSMEKGIKIQGELIEEPSTEQRAIFVSMNLLKALQQDNKPIQMASCVYLINRMPALSEVRANDVDSKVEIQLIESR